MTKTTLKVEVNTARYESSHGHAPRGRGSWAFCPSDKYDSADYLQHVYWVTSKDELGKQLPFSAAKRAAQSHFSALGVSSIVACS